MDFGSALAQLKAGKRIQRAHHKDFHTRKYEAAVKPGAVTPGKQVTEEIQLNSWVSLVNGAMVFHTQDGREIPWHPEHDDVLAGDWAVV